MNKEQAKTISEKLYKEGIIVLSTNASQDMTQTIFDIINYANDNPNKEITLYILSRARSYYNMLSLYDVIKSISNPVSCVVVGSISAYATLLAAACTKGKRYALAHASLEISQPVSFLNIGSNLETDVTINAIQVSQERKEYEALLAKETGIDEAEIHRLSETQTVIKTDEAIRLGIIDKVI